MRVLLEGFSGGSHRQLLDLIRRPGDHVITLPARKWHWRLLASSTYFADEAPSVPPGTAATLFATSMVNLAEFLALRPDYAGANVRKVLYFHENQLAYPSRQEDARKRLERDWQYGWAQVLSATCADVVCWNSAYNRDSFIAAIDRHLRVLPSEQRPAKRAMGKAIAAKSRVLFFPLQLDAACPAEGGREGDDGAGVSGHVHDGPLHILWAHRWEHDKGPEVFLRVAARLSAAGHEFRISVIGEAFGPNIPECFLVAEEQLRPHIADWGYLSSRGAYLQALRGADVAVSTAEHEFFGVSMLEAVLHGNCFPLVPRRLVYPELYPAACLYNTEQQLFKRLADFATRPRRLRQRASQIAAEMRPERFLWSNLREHFDNALAPPRPRRAGPSASTFVWTALVAVSLAVILSLVLSLVVLSGGGAPEK